MNQPLPVTYCLAVERGEPPVANTETIDSDTARGETMMLGLRLLRDGISAKAFRARHGCEFKEAYGDTVVELVEQGLLDWSDDRVRLSSRGLMLANDVCGRFV